MEGIIPETRSYVGDSRRNRIDVLTRLQRATEEMDKPTLKQIIEDVARRLVRIPVTNTQFFNQAVNILEQKLTSFSDVDILKTIIGTFDTIFHLNPNLVRQSEILNRELHRIVFYTRQSIGTKQLYETAIVLLCKLHSLEYENLLKIERIGRILQSSDISEEERNEAAAEIERLTGYQVNDRLPNAAVPSVIQGSFRSPRRSRRSRRRQASANPMHFPTGLTPEQEACRYNSTRYDGPVDQGAVQMFRRLHVDDNLERACKGREVVVQVQAVARMVGPLIGSGQVLPSSLPSLSNAVRPLTDAVGLPHVSARVISSGLRKLGVPNVVPSFSGLVKRSCRAFEEHERAENPRGEALADIYYGTQLRRRHRFRTRGIEPLDGANIIDFTIRQGMPEIGHPELANLFNGFRYLGQGQGTTPNGQGKLYDEAGNLFYDGQWRNGKQHGEGIEYYSNDTPLYSGSWRNGLRHGQGIRYYVSGNRVGIKRYEGEYVNGEESSTGKRYYSDGRIDYSRGQANATSSRSRVPRQSAITSQRRVIPTRSMPGTSAFLATRQSRNPHITQERARYTRRPGRNVQTDCCLLQ